ncbi:MAG: FAD-dependent oxidoreductase [Oscillospiraceae bacterium]
MAARKSILALAKHFDGKNHKETDPEYYAFAGILTDEQAEMLVHFRIRHAETVEDIAKAIGQSYEETFKRCTELAEIGMLITRAQPDGTDKFELYILVPGIFELLELNHELTAKHPEIAKAFEEYTRVRSDLAPMVPIGNGPMRVIPVEAAISSETRAAPYEEISHWLTKYQNHLSVGPCQCRLARAQMGEGCGDIAEETCIIMGSAAESCIAQGKTRRITVAEAQEILIKCEKRGYTHQVTNIDGKDMVWAICNCNVDVCFALRGAVMTGSPNWSRSNYVASVEPEKCSACGQCVETCPANAVRLGPDLCTKTPVSFPVTPLPDNHNWGPQRYNMNYRENFQNSYECGSSPCKATCPAHISVQGYIKLAAQGRYTEALELIKKENPFPAVCGRICPHNCENECTRGKLDEPIAIDEIKKFLADMDLNAKTRFIPEVLYDYHDVKFAVIGSGPAGLSCAYYLAVHGYSVTVFEKEEKPGGMLTMGIPSFRLEKDVIMSEIEVLRQLGVEFKTGVEVGRDITLDALRAEGYKGFYLAIGAQAGRKLGIEGEDGEGVIAGVDFLRAVNLGKNVETEGKVLVIGGGNVAIDVARTALRTKAGTVEMFCLEGAQEMSAQDEEVQEAKAEGVVVNNGWGPNKIVLENGKVSGVEFKKCVRVFDKDGKFSPEYDEKTKKFVQADKVLISVGQSIVWGDLLKGSRVELNRNGTAKADTLSYMTAEPDVFVGGDVFTGPKFAIDAIAAGKEGAESLHRIGHPGQTQNIGRNRRIFRELDKSNVVFDGYDHAKRRVSSNDSTKKNTFSDPRITFTEEQLKAETDRCLGCGAARVDPNKCLGCGECTVRCKFDAISLTRQFDGSSVGAEHLKAHAVAHAVGNKIRAIVNPDRNN